MRDFGPPEKVYVELEWYDGPRKGVADIGGVPHRFCSHFDENDDQPLGTFVVFPIDQTMLVLEQEQWNIFVLWNTRYESGQETIETHPGQGGLNPRWDELEEQLKESRSVLPSGAKLALAKTVSLKQRQRYSETGPDYSICWKMQ